MSAAPVGRPRRGAAAAVFVLLWVLSGTWAVATPLFGAPDEPAHVIRAAAVARGQILGKSAPGRGRPDTAVRVPRAYDVMGARIGCWVHDPETTPSCAGRFPGTSPDVDTTTYVGRYNPVYYAVVGLPSRLSSGASGVYLMRILSAAVGAGLLTMAVLAAMRSKRPPLALLGVALCLTPMVCFLAGTVNPNGLEVAASVCLWTAGILVLDGGSPGRPSTVWAAVGASALVVSRGLSPVWLGVIVVLLGVATGRDRVRALLHDRRLRVPAAAVAVASLAAVAWTALARALAVAPVGRHVGGSSARVALVIMGDSSSMVHQMVGALQWLEIPVPTVTFRLWLVGVGTISLLALVAGPPRVRVALGACAAATMLSPLLQVPSAATVGLIWQGRYSLPVAVGVPILAAYSVSQARAEIVTAARRLAAGLVMALAVALLAAFYWVGRRNAVGTAGPFLFIGRSDWQPPVPFLVLLLVHATTLGLLVALFLRAARLDRLVSSAPG